MATAADAELILRLYGLRQEETLRRARKFLASDFNPKNVEELRTVSRAPGTEENAYWRQAMSYWEMAASLVLRGALDADLFLDSNGEGLFLYAKYHHFHKDTEAQNGPFMRNTAKLIEKYPSAKARYEAALKNLEARRQADGPKG
ncbi:MAG TPA: hypothetical protein VG714_03675 [Acidobacteriaceae bacterium]|nr:hypothetical protein [Acidobacteriaceae bacterium]